MRRRITEQIFSIRVDKERWLVLARSGRHKWHLRVFGPEPFDTQLVELTGSEAQDCALSLARRHFQVANPEVFVHPFQQWRAALCMEV